MKQAHFRAFLLTGAALGVLLPAASQAQDRVGVTGAVNPAASAQGGSQAMRTLVVGSDVIFNEAIVTGPEGQVQILFVDRSSMTVGPDTRLVIDEFAYDRDAAKGSLTATLTQGAIRFVGGAISKNEGGVKLNTPVATIGIRGGIGVVETQPNGATTAGLVFGNLSMSTGSGDVSITVPGFSSTVSGAGGAPSSPKLNNALLVGALGKLDPNAGGGGAQGGGPSDSTVAGSGVGQANSGDTRGSIEAAQHNNVGGPAGSNGLNINGAAGATKITDQANLTTIVQSSAAQSVVVPEDSPVSVTGRIRSLTTPATSFSRDSAVTGQVSGKSFVGQDGLGGAINVPVQKGSFNIGTAETPVGTLSGNGFLADDRGFFFADLSSGVTRAFVFGGTTFAGALPTDGRTLSFTLQPDVALATQFPFVRTRLTDNSGHEISGASVSNFFLQAPNGGSFTDGNTATLQASLAIDGTGAQQRSVIVVATGTAVADADNGPALSGVVRSTARVDASQSIITTESGFATVKTGTGARFFGKSLDGFVLDQTTYSDLGAVLPTSATERDPSQASPRTDFQFTQAAVAAKPADGPAPTRAGGTLTGFAAAVGEVQTSGGTTNYVTSGTATITNDPTTNRVAANISVREPESNHTIIGFNLQFGGAAAADRSKSAFINDSVFGATESSVAPATAVVADTNTQNSVSTDVAAVGGAVRTYMVSSDTVPVPGLLPGGKLCDCTFLKWGWWGGEIRQGADDPTSTRDRVNLGTWIAGPSVTLPTTGTASFQGKAIGNVSNLGANYIATGDFRLDNFNFATGQGAFQVSNFDANKNFSGTVNTNGGVYSANVTGDLAGSIQGRFFGVAGADPVPRETGGSFAVQNVGATYKAAGVFAGKR